MEQTGQSQGWLGELPQVPAARRGTGDRTWRKISAELSLVSLPFTVASY